VDKYYDLMSALNVDKKINKSDFENNEFYFFDEKTKLICIFFEIIKDEVIFKKINQIESILSEDFNYNNFLKIVEYN
jgi:hypothetical protein